MMPNTFKRFLCAAMALLMLVTLLPAGVITAEAADNDQPIDTAIIFTDLHSTKSSYKESTISAVFGQIKKAGLPVSSVTSGGDAFSVNEDNSYSNGPYDGYVSKINTSIRTALGNTGLPVNYVWSDHDRYAYQEDDTTLLDKTSHLVYGSGSDTIYGNDNDANYYVYALSMGDLCSYDRYSAGFNTDKSDTRTKKGFTATVDQAIANFKADADKLKKDRPLLIVSHQPLFDNRNDNAFAEKWFNAINEVAEEMDVAFFYGHNHKYDTGSDYYYAKGSSMPVTTTSGWNGYQTGSGTSYTKGDPKPVTKTLNFTHLCAGYMEPTSTNSYNNTTTRTGTIMAVNIYNDSIQFVTYNKNGVYSSGIAPINKTITRDHAAPAHEHNYNNVETVAATCTDAGSITKTCSCGEKQVDTIPALGHTLTSDATSSSCITGGIVTYTCSVCSYSYTEEVAATGHNYTSTTIEPTCTDEGYTQHVCENCGDSYTSNTVAALGHHYSTTVTDPTCAQLGKITYTCACGHIKTEDIPMLEHNYVTKFVAPTCTDKGYTVSTCSNCGHRWIDNFVTELGHNYVTESVAPTCTTNGYLLHTCTKCNDSYQDSFVATTGHSYHKTGTTAPTCTIAGYTSFSCSTCGDSYNGDYVIATGHSYQSTEENGYMVYRCTNCDDSYSVELERPYSYNKSSKLTTGKKYVITLYSNNKYYAVSHKDNMLTAVEVTVSGNEITSEVSEDLIWTYKSKKLCYESNGKTYNLYAPSRSTKLSISNNSASISLSGTKLKVGTYYLRYSNGNVTLNSSAGTTYLFNQIKN